MFVKEPFTECYADAFGKAEIRSGTAYFYGDNEFYVYNMFHLLKHLFYASGCGVRRFCDIYVLNKALKNSLDREYIHSMYEKYGVADKAQVVEELADALFGDGELTDDLQAMCDELMDSAVHGTAEGQVRISLNNIRQDGKRFVKLRYWLQRVFPPYEYMAWIYPQIDGNKALLPIFHLRRIFRIAFKERYKIKRAGKAYKNADKEKKNG